MIDDTPTWWPPKVDYKLRHFTRHTIGSDFRAVHALVYVLGVVVHAPTNQILVTIAEWLPSRQRWLYSVIGLLEARLNYWPDGQSPPEKHPCECCEVER